MRKYLCVLCLIVAGCQPPAPVKPHPDPVDSVRTLEADTRKIALIRPSGTNLNRQVGDYLAGELRKAGFRVTRQPFNQGTNIIGTRRGTSERTIILGSHYDSVLCPGADDNASGCAVNLSVARALARQKLRHTLTIVFFDAEEKGLFGSQHYARRMKEPCDFMVNLDMVGHLRASQVPDDVFNVLFRKYPWARAISFRAGDDSDHASFAAKGIPVLWVFTGIHERYHEWNDVPSTLNYRGMAQIAQYVQEVMLLFDKQNAATFIDALPPVTYQP